MKNIDDGTFLQNSSIIDIDKIDETPLNYKFNNRSDDSRDDSKRLEEIYTEKNEAFLNNIRKECLIKSELHNKESHRTKKINFYLSIPTYSICIPLILINLAIFITVPYIQPISLTTVSIMNAIMSMKNYSSLSEINNTYSGKYADLADEIDKILIRSKKFREPFDIVLERITLRHLHVNDCAPQI